MYAKNAIKSYFGYWRICCYELRVGFYVSEFIEQLSTEKLGGGCLS